jgi:hypothetical protein
MKAPEGWDLIGWKEIADTAGLHPDTCRRLSKRASDPLPVADFMGRRVIAKRDEIAAWVARQVNCPHCDARTRG